MKSIFISMIGIEERVLGFFKNKPDLSQEIDQYILFINKEFKNDSRVLEYKDDILNNFLKNNRYDILEASYEKPFVLAGTGSNSTQEAISLSQHAERCGADGLLIEVHPRPEEALSDGAQSLLPESQIRAIHWK